MTASSPQLHSLICPKCGAPLEIETNTPSIRCQYCSDTVENPYYRPPQAEPARPPMAPPPPRVYVPPPPRAYVPPARRSSPMGSLLRVVLFLIISLAICSGIAVAVGAVAGIQTISQLFPGGQLPAGLPQLSTLVPLNIETKGLWLAIDGAPNVIAVTWDITNDRYAITRLDLSTKKALWSVLQQKDYLTVDEFLAGESMVYAVIDTRLVALQLSDGKQMWEASLPDKLSGACKRCFVFQQGQVIILTTDNSLGAYDAQTGHQTWEKHFDATGYYLYPVSNGVGVTYRTKQGAALGIIDAASGDELTHIEPTCAPKGTSMTDQMEPYSNILLDTSSPPARAYIFYGLFNGCIQRWNLSSGKMEWEHIEIDQSLEQPDTPILFANGVFYFTQNNQLRSIDASTGKQVQTLDDTKDYSLVPLLVSGQRLVVRAKRTRGTTRFELWGYDLTTGKNLWKHPLLNSEPIDPPDEKSGLLDKDGTGWTYLQTPDGLWLITFQSTPNQVNLAQVNLETGEQSSQKTLSLEVNSSTDFYDIPVRLASQDHLVWFLVLNRIYVVDPAAGAFAYRWP